MTAPGVLDGDSDPDEDPLSAVLESGPSHGTLTLNANGSFTYTPPAGYVGTDSFTYRASDGTLESNPATVTITVTPPGPGRGQRCLQHRRGTALTVHAPGVLDGDSDPEDDPLSAALVSGPSHGTLTLNANGSFTYTPAADYDGTDSFTYRASDGSLNSSPATVTITVTAPPNEAPVAAADSYITAEDITLTVNAPGVLRNDRDPEGKPLSAVRVSGPSNGTLTLNANGSFTYRPQDNFNGSDSFTYRASDGSLASNPATVTITVTARNDAPTVKVAAGGTCGKDDHSGTVNLTVADVESPAAELDTQRRIIQPGAGVDRQREIRRQRRCPNDDREHRGRAQRHRDPDCHRHRWAGQRQGPGYGQGRRRWQGHPDRRHRRRPTLSPKQQRHAEWRGRE